MIPVKTFCDGIHKYQLDLLAEFDRRRLAGTSESQQFYAEWHRRARKTTLALNLCIREACRFANGKYVYVAPTQVQARNIIWDDPNMLRAYLPDRNEVFWTLNETKMHVRFRWRLSKDSSGKLVKSPLNSILIIGGADNPDSWRGTDFTGMVLDEWALMKEALWTEIIRPVMIGELLPEIKKYQPFRWVFFLYTPKPEGSHAHRMFDSACCLEDGGELPEKGRAPKMAPNTYVSRLDGELSGIYPSKALLQMQQEVREGKIPQAHYDQEVKCSRITAEEMTFVTTEMIYALNSHWEGLVIPDRVPLKIVSIDPAWGGDVCQIMGIVNLGVEEQESILDKMRESEIVMAAKVVARKIGTKNFIVDTVNAPGIYDRLCEDESNYNVQGFKSSYRPTERDDTTRDIVYANLRAQAYHYASLQIQTRTAGPINDAELIRQLPLASKYTTQGGSGRLIIIPKAQIKKDLGCSPDKADCYIMGLWGSQFVGIEQVRKSHSYSRPRSAMC